MQQNFIIITESIRRCVHVPSHYSNPGLCLVSLRSSQLKWEVQLPHDQQVVPVPGSWCCQSHFRKHGITGLFAMWYTTDSAKKKYLRAWRREIMKNISRMCWLYVSVEACIIYMYVCKTLWLDCCASCVSCILFYCNYIKFVQLA